MVGSSIQPLSTLQAPDMSHELDLWFCLPTCSFELGLTLSWSTKQEVSEPLKGDEGEGGVKCEGGRTCGLASQQVGRTQLGFAKDFALPLPPPQLSHTHIPINGVFSEKVFDFSELLSPHRDKTTDNVDKKHLVNDILRYYFVLCTAFT